MWFFCCCFPLILYTLSLQKKYSWCLLIGTHPNCCSGTTMEMQKALLLKDQYILMTETNVDWVCHFLVIASSQGARVFLPLLHKYHWHFFQATFNSNARHWILCSSCSSSAKNRNHSVKRLLSSKRWSLFYFQNNKRPTTVRLGLGNSMGSGQRLNITRGADHSVLV